MWLPLRWSLFNIVYLLDQDDLTLDARSLRKATSFFQIGSCQKGVEIRHPHFFNFSHVQMGLKAEPPTREAWEILFRKNRRSLDLFVPFLCLADGEDEDKGSSWRAPIKTYAAHCSLKSGGTSGTHSDSNKQNCNNNIPFLFQGNHSKLQVRFCLRFSFSH